MLLLCRSQPILPLELVDVSPATPQNRGRRVELIAGDVTGGQLMRDTREDRAAEAPEGRAEGKAARGAIRRSGAKRTGCGGEGGGRVAVEMRSHGAAGGGQNIAQSAHFRLKQVLTPRDGDARLRL